MSANEEITKLLRSAHADLIAARILNNDEEGPSCIICFHAQQAVEKSLKTVSGHNRWAPKNILQYISCEMVWV
ncbi:MAG: hypothetical protein CVV33_03045 [Methanomicrobiales archaeon HGW-Methanomicrobiales-4]|nr:MAG: hypothetical protein CVV33_03045 [Methanomicrobiales archaeon HGW-Methanomicrobiales-4]